MVAAIGHEVSAEGFLRFMTISQMQESREEYRPVPFAYAIRRSTHHHPEGVISLQSAEDEPIHTFMSKSKLGVQLVAGGVPAQLSGDFFVHGLMRYQFGTDSAPHVTLHLCAEHFSSYIVMIGRMIGAEFDPTYGLIVTNKDHVKIPLEMNSIPTAAEFKVKKKKNKKERDVFFFFLRDQKRATVSVSPEQQVFATMFRGKQLGDTFAVCVVQIKPTLERILRLEEFSLTREIQLTQDLIHFLVEYQLPPDLFSSCQKSNPLSYVKMNVNRMHLVVARAKICKQLDQLDDVRPSMTFSTASRAATLPEGIAAESVLQDDGQEEPEKVTMKEGDMYNVSKSDPASLHKCFLHCKSEILNASWLTTADEAVVLAGLQLQSEVGDYDPQVSRESLPARFLPLVHCEKIEFEKIARRWASLQGKEAVVAEYAYVQTCRQLPMFEAVPFQCKQKRKNEIVRVILCVTRDSIAIVDSETKEMMKIYPLEHLRRWADNKVSFTLDFGSYEDEYVILETVQGSEISALLSSLIDILLKRRGDGVMSVPTSRKKPTAKKTVVKHGLEPDEWTSQTSNKPTKDFDEKAAVQNVGALSVKLVDGTVKTVVATQGETAAEMIAQIGAKIGLQNTEEYGIKMGERWLDQNRPLSEQGVHDLSQVEFKKRYFVDDLNVDKSDPIQLHLVYLQSRDAILTGEYPVQLEEAIQIAAVQLQVEMGNYDPQTHNDEWFHRSEFLPAAHQKKVNWTDIARAWQKMVNMSKMNAYYKYVQTCRQLPTYGITTFEVREKRDQGKLVTVLLGVTRDSVMRMDLNTKEVIKAYPLEHVRRWAAAKTSFTLDFGTYEKDYYTVATSRGEEISQLLSGYIDIMLRNRQMRLDVSDDDVDVAEMEELGPLIAVPNLATRSHSGLALSNTLLGAKERLRERLLRQLAEIDRICASLEEKNEDTSFNLPPVDAGAAFDHEMRDVSGLSAALDAALEKLDMGAVRPVVVTVGTEWIRERQGDVVAPRTKHVLKHEQQRLERQRCFDLLDALTLSGTVPICNSALHVIVANTHCFEKSVINTLVMDNESPIHKAEKAASVMADHII